MSRYRFILGRVRINGCTFRAWVRMQLLPVVAYSVPYDGRDVDLQQLGDGSFCELQTAVVGG